MKPADLVPLGHGLAGLAHELRNVMAILGQSTGLVCDLLSAGHAASCDERVLAALDRVTRQLDRADMAVARLSRLAHTFDDPDAPAPVGHLLEQALFLLERRARTRDVALECAPCAGREVRDPVRVLLRLAAVLESAVDALPAGSTLTLALSSDRIVVSGAHGDGPGDPRVDRVVDLDLS